MLLKWDNLSIRLADLVTTPRALLGVSVILLLVFFGTRVFARRRLNLPFIPLPDPGKYAEALVEATSRYPETPFVIPVSPPMVIMPMCTFEEVRNLPENQVSFEKEIKRMMLYDHTGIGQIEHELKSTVRVDLTRNTAGVLDALQDEVRFAFEQEFGSKTSQDWTSFRLYEKLVRVVALVSGRAFVGRPLSRNEEWISSSIEFTSEVENVRRAILKYPWQLRTIVGPFLPEVKRMKYHRSRMTDLLKPILQAVMEEKDRKVYVDGSQDQQGTTISWLLKYYTDNTLTASKLAHQQTLLTQAALHTTTMSSFQIVLDLAARPAYIHMLRAEIEAVIQTDGYETDEEGYLKLKKPSMTKLRKLDSFMKESQRIHFMGHVSNLRLTTAPLKLSTGHTLPTDTRFCYPSHVVHTSPQTPCFQSSNNPPSTLPPSEFDGLRFYNLRSMPGNENKHQFVSTSPESLNFGHGNHTCPGRFFASNEIKVILVELLRNWDFRLVGGVTGEEARPKSLGIEFSSVPDPEVEIEIRRREI